jgi:hypothetical protein
MAKIPASKVIVSRRYIVDCEVCDESVEPESGGFASRQEADEAKQRHLDGHNQPDPQPDPWPAIQEA